jgi:hypothetical protein
MISQKTILTRLYPIAVIIIFGSLVIARVLWPTENAGTFSDVWETISGLGDMEDNPIGFILFQFAMTILGILILIVVFYVHPNLSKLVDRKGSVKIGSFWLLMGGLGFVLTGLIPDGVVKIPDWDKFHEITAGLGTIGVIFAALFYFRPVKKAGPQINQKLLWVITAVWWIPLLFTGIFYGIAELLVKEVWFESCHLGWYSERWGECGVPGYYSFAVWERVIFGIIVIYQGMLIKLIPESNKK